MAEAPGPVCVPTSGGRAHNNTCCLSCAETRSSPRLLADACTVPPIWPFPGSACPFPRVVSDTRPSCAPSLETPGALQTPMEYRCPLASRANVLADVLCRPYKRGKTPDIACLLRWFPIVRRAFPGILSASAPGVWLFLLLLAASPA